MLQEKNIITVVTKRHSSGPDTPGRIVNISEVYLGGPGTDTVFEIVNDTLGGYRTHAADDD
jgi:hypothetical protein